MTWLVLGGGISGCGAAALLRQQKKKVVLCDDRPLAQATREKLHAQGVNTLSQAEALEGLGSAWQSLVISPGISLEHPLITAAYKKKLEVMSEIDLALHYYQGKLIGITGTNGKSTIAAMTHHLLRRAGKNAGLAGNIGISLCQYLTDHGHPEILVLELSSYQLEVSQRVHADVGIIVNLSPDHLERHHRLEDYYGAKWRLFTQQAAGKLSLITEEAYEVCTEFNFPAPQSTLQMVGPEQEKQVLPFSLPEISSRHNRQNAVLATLAVASLLGVSPAKIGPLIAGYQGLPHRYQLVARKGEICVINDSKATNIHATLTALASSEGKIILMLGGKGKGESFLPVLQYKAKISEIIAFGYSGPEIAKQLRGEIPLTIYPTLKQALETRRFDIKTLAYSLLFSPACASYDEFAHFEERGAFFTKFF